MPLPNFLILGAAKAGTTALHHYLNQHPQVAMSRQKEPHFLAFQPERPSFAGPGDDRFTAKVVTSLDAYQAMFEQAPVMGDASPWYLYHPATPGNIERFVPEAKMLIVLRNPVDRAYSSYLHTVRDGREQGSFEEALTAEPERIRQGWEFIWHLTAAGRYAEQVERFTRRFGSQVRVDLYEDFEQDEAGYLGSILEFLGLDPSFTFDTSVKPNATGVPSSGAMGKFMFGKSGLREALKRVLPARLRYRMGQQVRQRLMTRPEVSAATRARLVQEFRPDIERLQGLIGRDLSSWLNA